MTLETESETETMPRVLHVIPSLAVAGTERQLVGFIKRSSAPMRHAVAVFDEEGALASELPSPPHWVGPFGRTPKDLPKNVRAVFRLRRLVRSLKPTLVHAHLGISEVLAAAAVPRGVPLVSSHRGINVGLESNPLLRAVEGLAHRRLDLLLCNSAWLAGRTIGSRWAPVPRVIHNAVDLDAFAPVPLPGGDKPTVVMVANFGPEKRHDIFLGAFADLIAGGMDVRAILVGDGPERSRVEALTRELGVQKNVELAGLVMDTRPFLAQAHVVVLTSAYEGFPNALLEGMAMGRPVVATRVGGIPELVRHGADGFLVEMEPRDVADAIRSLTQDRSRLEAMGASAAARAAEFGWDRMVRETEEVYRAVAGMRRARTSGGARGATCVG